MAIKDSTTKTRKKKKKIPYQKKKKKPRRSQQTQTNKRTRKKGVYHRTWVPHETPTSNSNAQSTAAKLQKREERKEVYNVMVQGSRTRCFTVSPRELIERERERDSFGSQKRSWKEKILLT